MVNQEEPDDMELCDLCDICKTEVKRKDMQRGFNVYTNDEPPTWEMICNNCLKSIENTSVPEEEQEDDDEQLRYDKLCHEDWIKGVF